MMEHKTIWNSAVWQQLTIFTKAFEQKQKKYSKGCALNQNKNKGANQAKPENMKTTFQRLPKKTQNPVRIHAENFSLSDSSIKKRV